MKISQSPASYTRRILSGCLLTPYRAVALDVQQRRPVENTHSANSGLAGDLAAHTFWAMCRAERGLFAWMPDSLLGDDVH